MRGLHFALASAILALANGSALPTEATHNTTEPDVTASWVFSAYSDGGCSTALRTDGGNTPSGCRNVNDEGAQANSYRFRTSFDPETGVSFALTLYAGQNCQSQIGTDNGLSDNCKSLTFESYQVNAAL